MEFIDSIRQVKSQSLPYKNWLKEQNDVEAQRQALHNLITTPSDKLKLAKNKGRAIIDSVNVMDEYSEDKAENIEALTEQLQGLGPLAGGAVGSIPVALYRLLSKNPGGKTTLALMAFPAAGMAAGIFGSIIASSSVQKAASRIARFQSRETVLKDPRNFVVYTPDQIKAAEEIAATTPDKAPAKNKASRNPIANIKEVLDTARSLMKDKKAYKEWLSNSKLAETERKKLYNLEATPEQLEKAKKEQDLLFRTINKIDIASQDYSENIEMATNGLIGAGLAGGGIAGGIISGTIWILEKIKLVPKNAPYAGKIKTFAAPVLTATLGIIASIYALKMQKEAARVGRFKAKQELLNDPHNFISYTPEQLNLVKNIKAPDVAKKGVIKGVIDDIKFFSIARKDYKDYQTYKKLHVSKEETLRDALKKVSVSTEQMNEAGQLQDKVFRVFDKMDEMSQRYSEDVEAGTQLIQQAVAPVVGIAGGALGGATAYMFKAGPVGSAAASLLVTIPTAIAMEYWATKHQKLASKIGLMKSMQDLKDPRNFVDYTDEQKLQAQSFNGNQILSTTASHNDILNWVNNLKPVK